MEIIINTSLLNMDDHNDLFFSNILLENINNNIPLSIDVLIPCKKIPNPNKKTESSSEKYSQTAINRSKQDLSEKIKRYISSLEKSCKKSYIDEYITSLKDQISGLKSEVIFLRKELNNKNELVTFLTAAKSSSNINGISSPETTYHKDNRDKKVQCEPLSQSKTSQKKFKI